MSACNAEVWLHLSPSIKKLPKWKREIERERERERERDKQRDRENEKERERTRAGMYEIAC